jgi:hypothetical protein
MHLVNVVLLLAILPALSVMLEGAFSPHGVSIIVLVGKWWSTACDRRPRSRPKAPQIAATSAPPVFPRRRFSVLADHTSNNAEHLEGNLLDREPWFVSVPGARHSGSESPSPLVQGKWG